MTNALLLVALLGAGPLPADTIVEMRRGDRVELTNLEGEITIETWGRDALEIVGEDGDAALVAEHSAGAVQIRRSRRRRRAVEATIRVPEWADVEVGGRSLDIYVNGVGGTLRVGNVSGDIRIQDVAGAVEVRSIDGEIVVRNARAGVNASSQSDDVTIVGAAGPVQVHSGSGDLVLTDIDSESVRAETQDGDISFSGSIADGGSYGFFVHDGDADIAVPPSMSARVSVSTFDGEFESDFPVLVQRFTGGREFDFVVGDGSARIEIEVFDGEIRLLRR